MRHLPFEAVFNFRDLGGYATADGGTIRWQHIYRADALHRFTSDEAEQIRSLNLRTVIDLRQSREIEERGRFPVEDHPVSWEHASMIVTMWDAYDRPETDEATYDFLAERYADMLVEGADSLRRIFALLALPESYPVVFHCAAGKDRTGTLAALLLDLAGVDDEVIAEDYSLSTAPMVPLQQWIRENVHGGREDMVDGPKAFLAAPPEAMRRFLARLRDTHGGARGYLRALGFDDASIDAIVANVVEPA